MGDIRRLAQGLLRSPVGCAFLLIVNRDGVDPAVAVTPAHATRIVAAALHPIRPWASNAGQVIDEIVEAGGRLRDLAHEIVSQPGVGWWYEPLDRKGQVWIPMGGLPVDKGRCLLYMKFDPQQARWMSPANTLDSYTHLEVDTPVSKPSNWSSPYYGENFRGWQATSTVLENGVSCWEVLLTSKAGDWGVDGTSRTRPRVRVAVAGDARIYEVQDAEDWHSLCCRYPTAPRETNPLARNVTVPDWSLAAEDWDGVHLTFGGLLTAPWVSVVSGSVHTRLWTCNTEWTLWLRDDVLRVEENLGPLMADFLYPGRGERQTGYDYLYHHGWRWSKTKLPAILRPDIVERIVDATIRERIGGDGPDFVRVGVQTVEGEVRFVSSAKRPVWTLEQCIDFVNPVTEETAAFPSYRELR